MSTFQYYEMPFGAQIARILIDDERRNGYGNSRLIRLWRGEAQNAEASQVLMLRESAAAYPRESD
jgi:hypothetical protein